MSEGNIRTDLAAEIKEFRKLTEKDGFYDESSEKDGIKFREVRILNSEAAKKIGKPVGTYITVDFGIAFEDDAVFDSAAEVIAEKIRDLVGLDLNENVLLIGLGNSNLTSDAIGPETLSGVIVTRHLKSHLPEIYSTLPLRELSALTPGVLGTTGIETVDIVKAVAEKTKPSLIVAIDALASRRAERVCSTVQMSDSGISPGSGVGNHRKELSRKTLGVPVISIGVPTVIDTATLTYDTFEALCTMADSKVFTDLIESGAVTYQTVCDALGESSSNMIVTPRDIDVLVNKASRLLAFSLNMALHGDLTPEEIRSLLN